MSLQEDLAEEYRQIQRAMTKKLRSRRRASHAIKIEDDAASPNNQTTTCQSPRSPKISSRSGSVSSRRTSASSSRRSGTSPPSSRSSLDGQALSPTTSIGSLPFSPSSSHSHSHSCPSRLALASRRSVELIRFFFNELSSRIVFAASDGGDSDWKQLLLPLSYINQAFRNAICAFVSAHLEAMDIITGRNSLDFHRAALLGLSVQVHNEPADAASSLATILLLIKYEALVGEDVSSIYSHLHAANNLLGLFPETDDPTMSFLRRTFRSYDTIIALSQGCCAVGDAPALPATPSSPHHSPRPRADSAPNAVDPVFGIAEDLWALLHRLCGLRPLLEELAAASFPDPAHGDGSGSGGSPLKAAVLRGELDALCAATEKALAAWQPPDAPPGQHAATALHHHALAYRDSALVHLYRAVYLLPSSHPAVRERCRSSLAHCVAAASSPSSTSSYGPTSRALLWPLFVAACAAAPDFPGHDRRLARSAFELVGKRQEMAGAKRAWLVVTRAWAVMDGHAGGQNSGMALDVFPVMRNLGNMMGSAVMLW